MSVSPSIPAPAEVLDPPAVLRLVPPHEHAWRLLSVEYDDGLEVRYYECSGCREVQFR